MVFSPFCMRSTAFFSYFVKSPSRLTTISDLLAEAKGGKSARDHLLVPAPPPTTSQGCLGPPLTGRTSTEASEEKWLLTLCVSEEAHARLHPPLQTVELRRSGDLDKLLLQRQLEDLEELFSPPQKPVVIYLLS